MTTIGRYEARELKAEIKAFKAKRKRPVRPDDFAWAFRVLGYAPGLSFEQAYRHARRIRLETARDIREFSLKG